ncbi:TniQ family protein [Stenotrophomonas lactitubi]|uniref:TniQ family protein n=1 Tax=Stenotrophomonas lactitubi TaxID=2045214 RepID=A0AAW4GIA2_9GAMM|nr:TniQ family protein [Stenotrophomonas lactitubi]MBM9922852.1 TniQ family protein [Stenotrophomonas lactitubi]MBM9938657.1 TniQ family protein [Stenotrophomonas lactitubi]
MSTFFLKVLPIGIATDEVESLLSFLFRLASANGVTLIQLVELARRARLHSATGEHCSKPQRAFDLRAQLSAVEALSGNKDLARLTYLPLSADNGAATGRSLRDIRAWCEQCFVEDHRVGRQPFDRLIWSARFMMRCPFHKVLLRTTCPICMDPQPVRGKRNVFSTHGVDRCVYCASSLVGPTRLLRPEFRPFFGEIEVQELVGAISTGDLTSTGARCLATFYQSLDGSSRLREEMESDLLPDVAHSCLPTIANVVATACKYQVSAVSLILTPELAAEQVNRFFFDSHFVPGRARIKSEALLLQSIRTTLEAGMHSPPEHPIPTLAQVGALFAMRNLNFVSSFPVLAEKYLERTRWQAARVLDCGLG